jgi:Uma2 family endonuclease
MKALILQLSEEELGRRRKIGLDRWDEMWEGVLHMPPAPLYEHQRIQSETNIFLVPLLSLRKRGIMVPGVNVFDESSHIENYRIPDFSFVAEGRREIIAEDGIRGGPDAVVEIRSPGDETYEKLGFYAKVGVREVLVIDRDTKKPEVFRLAGGRYLAVSTDRDGWIHSEVLSVRMRRSPSGPRLEIEDIDDPSARTEI